MPNKVYIWFLFHFIVTLKLEMIDLSCIPFHSCSLYNLANPISLKGESCIEELVKLNISKPLRFLILFCILPPFSILFMQIIKFEILLFFRMRTKIIRISWFWAMNSFVYWFNFILIRVLDIFSNEDITLVNQLVYTPSHKDSLIHIESILFSVCFTG